MIQTATIDTVMRTLSDPTRREILKANPEAKITVLARDLADNNVANSCRDADFRPGIRVTCHMIQLSISEAVCLIMVKATSPGAQPERRGGAGPVRDLLGGKASPAAFLVALGIKRCQESFSHPHKGS